MQLFFILVCVVFIAKIDAAKILAYIPFPSISHQMPSRALFQELARRGHDVTVITTDPAFPKGKTPPNLTEIDIHDVSYGTMIKSLTGISKGVKSNSLNQMRQVFSKFTDIIDAQLNTTEVQNVIHRKKYDLLFLEAWSRPALALSYVHKTPIILISSLGAVYYVMEAIGAPTHPILYPTVRRHRIYNLTIWEKLYEIYNHFKCQNMVDSLEERENKMLQKYFGKILPSLSELYDNVDMVFLNMHPILEGNRPVPPGVINMWGINIKPQKILPKDLKNYLDSSKHGVIYMSFGSNTDPAMLPAEKIAMFVKVFCQLPYDVLWKWNKDELPGMCKNIKIGKWFPQSDLLRHPNIKAFVSHAGLLSIEEAITAGVPQIAIPMFGDHWYNVEKCVVRFNIGVHLDMETLTEEKFNNALTTVTGDESFLRNIKHLDTLMRDEPMSGLQRAVWWTEHVLRHGGARHLRAPAANISWAQYLELELVSAVLLALLAVIVFIFIIFRTLYRYFTSASVYINKVKKN